MLLAARSAHDALHCKMCISAHDPAAGQAMKRAGSASVCGMPSHWTHLNGHRLLAVASQFENLRPLALLVRCGLAHGLLFQAGGDAAGDTTQVSLDSLNSGCG
jgi:hypothetical protein